MTKEEAKKILEAYRETDEDTGDTWGLKVLKYLGANNDGHVFEVIADDTDVKDYEIIPQYVVCKDKTVLVLPL